MSSRKRGRGELEAADEPSILDRIRNMWQFANLMQFLFIFGKVVKVDENLGIDVSHGFGALSSTRYCGSGVDG